MGNTNKEPVRLRRRITKTGNTSLYLDIYVNGERHYEYLKLYLIPEKTRKDKETNRQTLQLAEAVCAKRLVEVRNGQYGFNSPEAAKEIRLVEYMEMLLENRKDTGTNYDNWASALYHVRTYFGETKKLVDVTRNDVEGFVRYFASAKCMDRRKHKSGVWETEKLSPNSICSYFAKFRATINDANSKGLIPINPCSGVKSPKYENPERVFLTVDEVKMLYETPCYHSVLKRAFLFSCLTGLRSSDIMQIKWKDVSTVGDMTRITFAQQKTKSQEYLDISPEAVEFLGERGDDNEKVFQGYHYGTHMLEELKAWAEQAGIKKHVTFHSGRHTFAVMMIELGADIYTVSKLLGHADVSTTQIYTKVLDAKKRDAVNMIPKLK